MTKKRVPIYPIRNGDNPYEVKGITTYYDSEDRLHRTDGPALMMGTERTPHGGTNPVEYAEWEHYYLHGIPHRENGPARIHYDDYSNIKKLKSFEYYNMGQRHRIDGAACFTQYPTRSEVEYYVFGYRINCLEDWTGHYSDPYLEYYAQ